MALNARLVLAVFCLLVSFLGTVLTKAPNLRGDITDGPHNDLGQRGEDVWRGKDPETKEKPQKGRRSAEDLKDTPKTVSDFMTTNVPLVKEQIQVEDGVDYAAIWVQVGNEATFAYVPADESKKPIPNSKKRVCAPPLVEDAVENHLVARECKECKSPVDAEEILKTQVMTHLDLLVYTSTLPNGLTRVMMYTKNHPCQDCAQKLVDICERIQDVNGNRNETPDCILVFSADYATDEEKHGQEKTDVLVRSDIINGALQVYQMDEPA